MKKIFALGFFDGVHLGHQALLAACCRMSREKQATPCAITFEQHPQTLFTDDPPKLINSASDRCCLLQDHGIERVQALQVTKESMSKSWTDFLEELAADGAVGFVCGRDFRFGHRGAGNADGLAQFCAERGFGCEIIEEQRLKEIRVSSTHIRNLLEAGELEEAVVFLGHPHILSGEVTTGRKLGRTLGIPTANLLIPEGVVCPKYGVYACKAIVEGTEYLAVTNVGNRPTVGGHRVTVEPWLLDFEGDLYGKTITLLFFSFLRPEKKFDSLEELKAEIQENARQTRKFFEKT